MDVSEKFDLDPADVNRDRLLRALRKRGISLSVCIQGPQVRRSTTGSFASSLFVSPSPSFVPVTLSFAPPLRIYSYTCRLFLSPFLAVPCTSPRPLAPPSSLVSRLSVWSSTYFLARAFIPACRCARTHTRTCLCTYALLHVGRVPSESPSRLEGGVRVPCGSSPGSFFVAFVLRPRVRPALDTPQRQPAGVRLRSFLSSSV